MSYNFAAFTDAELANVARVIKLSADKNPEVWKGEGARALALELAKRAERAAAPPSAEPPLRVTVIDYGPVKS